MKSSKLILILTLLFISVKAALSQDVQKMVVAHYMTGMPIYSNSVADLKKEMVEAHNLGVDAFQLNMNSWNYVDYKLTVANMYQAASECAFPFYLFPSAGFGISSNAAILPWSYNDIKDYLQLYANHPNQLKVNGCPLFTSWLGENMGVEFWKSTKKSLLDSCGINMFYVPWHAAFLAYGSTTPLTAAIIDKYLLDWNGVIDGFFWWGASRSPFSVGSSPEITAAKSIPTAAEYLSDALKAKSMLFMTPVVPSFWATCKDPCKYTEHFGAKSLESQWMSIVNKQTARWVNMVTWNDKGEDTHWSPILIPSTTPKVAVYSHAGYGELNKYYMQWWKTGQKPFIEKDKIFYFYKNQFQNAVPFTETCTFNCNDTLPDKIYVTTMLGTPGQLTINSGDKTTYYDAPAGVLYWEADMGEGMQRFKLTRNGKVLIDATGGMLVTKIPEYKSRSSYSGFCEASVINTMVAQTTEDNFISISEKSIQSTKSGVIQLYNFQGIKVLEYQIISSLEINLSTGIYFVKFIGDDKSVENVKMWIK